MGSTFPVGSNWLFFVLASTLPDSTFTLGPETTDDKGTQRAALALALLLEAVEGHPERMKHVKRQSPSPLSGAGL
ncbi:hypothetical protein D623_10023763 [Myotis brandtii]|uniref:Secreted protein n=1 Tax=Myotis brandtii TaxID=109478 RepID=S7Q5R8_MYOBR|nr:hypothetical protein D623_10023763 [Myotis brandtii]